MSDEAFPKRSDPDIPANHDIYWENSARVLRLSHGALDRLDIIARSGLKLRPGIVETGGILIGTQSRGHSLTTVVDAIAVETDHAFGRSFRPSDSDIARFAAIIDRHSTGDRRVIGYFRSNLFCNDLLCNDPGCRHPRDLSLRPDDKNLLRRCFGRGAFVMLVEPGGAKLSGQIEGPSDAARQSAMQATAQDSDKETTIIVCFWDQHRDLEPIESIRLVGGASSVGGKVPVLQAVPEPAISRHPETLRNAWIGIAAAITLPAVFALGWMSSLRFTPKTATLPPAALLQLDAEAHGAVVDLRWNPAGASIDGSTGGALDIVDGPNVSRIDLSAEQLHSGHYEYPAVHSNVTCMMTIYRDNDVFVGVTRHVHVNIAQNGRDAALPVRRETASPSVWKTGQTPRAGDEGPGEADSTPNPAFKLPAVAPGPEAAPRFDEPPQLRAESGAPVSPAVLNVRLPDPPAIPPPPAPKPAATSATISVSGASAPPVHSTGAAPAFTPAIAVRRVTPRIPVDTRAQIRQPVTIRLSLLVNTEGRVTDVLPLEKTDTTGTVLTTFAEQAARGWRFTPAHMNGIPVVSQAVITFQFTPND